MNINYYFLYFLASSLGNKYFLTIKTQLNFNIPNYKIFSINFFSVFIKDKAVTQKIKVNLCNIPF
jgi:hypothetical protein